MYPTPEILTNKLWEDFELFIKGNWTVPIELGMKDGKVKKRILSNDFGHFSELNKIQPQIKFCQILCQIVRHNLAQKGKDGFRVPHENTMRNFLKAGFSASTQKNTLNAFAAFLGYENWTDFRRKNAHYIAQQTIEKNTIIRQTTASIQVIPLQKKIAPEIPQLANFTVTQKRKRIRFRRVLIVCIFISALFGIVQHYFAKTDEKEINEVLSAVTGANNAEFIAYCNIPHVDTSSLDFFFANSRPDASARAAVVSTIARAKKNGRVLVTPASSYNLIHIDVKEIRDSVAFVSTREKWHLSWLDTLLNKEVIVYDTTNSHNYILVKQDKRWKILMDDYEGKFRRPAS